MTGRKITAGLCVICALAISAVSAQAAMATGTTAHTAGEEAGIPNGTTTELRGSSGTTTIRSTSSGVKIAIQSTSVTVKEGTILNEESGGEMVAHGVALLVFEGATVTAPAGKGCVIESGEFESSSLLLTTAGVGMFVEFAEPLEPPVFATFTMKGCSVKALNRAYQVEGQVKGVPTGTEIVFTQAETLAQGTFTVNGQAASLEGSLSLTARANSSESMTALETQT